MSKAKELFEQLSGHLRGNVADPDAIMALVNGVNSLSLYAQELETKLASSSETGPLKLDTDRQVFFYEQDHYYLSNFSAFRLQWAGLDFDTSEHAYHWERFNGHSVYHQQAIITAPSAHEAFRYAQNNKADQRPDWDLEKVPVMRSIQRAKADQHEYVRRKLLETGERELIENSWRDAFWGWGPNRDGKNMLGRLWMEIRAELRHEASHG